MLLNKVVEEDKNLQNQFLLTVIGSFKNLSSSVVAFTSARFLKAFEFIASIPLFPLFAVISFTFNVANMNNNSCIYLAIESILSKILQQLQLQPAVYCSEISYTVDHCSENQIAVVTLYFHCSFNAKVSSVKVDTTP